MSKQTRYLHVKPGDEDPIEVEWVDIDDPEAWDFDDDEVEIWDTAHLRGDQYPNRLSPGKLSALQQSY